MHLCTAFLEGNGKANSLKSHIVALVTAEGMSLNGIPVYSFRGFVLETPIEEVKEDWRYRQPSIYPIVSFLHIRFELRLTTSEEWKDTCYQDEEIHSQTPYICLVSIHLPLHDLWRHTQRCSAVGLHHFINV